MWIFRKSEVCIYALKTFTKILLTAHIFTTLILKSYIYIYNEGKTWTAHELKIYLRISVWIILFHSNSWELFNAFIMCLPLSERLPTSGTRKVYRDICGFRGTFFKLFVVDFRSWAFEWQKKCPESDWPRAARGWRDTRTSTRSSNLRVKQWEARSKKLRNESVRRLRGHVAEASVERMSVRWRSS